MNYSVQAISKIHKERCVPLCFSVLLCGKDQRLKFLIPEIPYHIRVVAPLVAHFYVEVEIHFFVDKLFD